LIGMGAAIGIGIFAAGPVMAASSSLDNSIHFELVTKSGSRIEVDTELDVPLAQASRADVETAIEASLGTAAWSELTSEERQQVVSEAIGIVKTKLQTPWASEHQHWHFSGPFGTYDRMALQRGFQVYREVCASCHSLEYISFRNLGQPGGPEFSEEEVKALAAEYTVTDGPDEQGDMFERPAKPSDNLPQPYPNDQIARLANGGALPPDLSLMAKARHHGSDYLYSLLNGYDHAVPPLMEIQPGLHYNPYFSGRQIAMPKQLFEGLVEYADGTEATPQQMARDVAEFLTWAAEPKMEQRKAMAIPVLVYLLVLTLFLYMSYKRIWRNVDH